MPRHRSCFSRPSFLWQALCRVKFCVSCFNYLVELFSLHSESAFCTRGTQLNSTAVSSCDVIKAQERRPFANGGRHGQSETETAQITMNTSRARAWQACKRTPPPTRNLASVLIANVTLNICGILFMLLLRCLMSLLGQPPLGCTAISATRLLMPAWHVRGAFRKIAAQ